MNIGYFQNINVKIKGQEYKVYKLKGDIEISLPYSLSVTIASLEKLNISTLIGEDVNLEYEMKTDIVTKLSIDGYVSEINFLVKKENYFLYSIQLSHPMKKLHNSSDLLVHSEKTLKEIVMDRLNTASFSTAQFSLGNNNKITAVQFSETDLNFLHKIFNHTGIFYYFDFVKKTVVFSDDVNFYSKNLSENKNEIISNILKLDLKNTEVYGRLGQNSNLEKVTTISSQSEAKGKTVSFSSNYKDNNFTKNLMSVKKAVRLFDKVYISRDLSAIPGSVYGEELIYKMTFDCDYENSSKENVYVYTCSSSALIVPKYEKVNLPVFLLGKIDEPDNKYSIDDEGFVKVKPYFDSVNFIKARYSSAFSGNGYGITFIPRGGTEVMLAFFDELMSYPVIISCLYNETIKRPYEDDFTSFIKTETIGNEGNLQSDLYNNEIVFFDKSGSEDFKISGRKDMKQHAMNQIEVKAKKEYDLETEKYNISVKEGHVHIKEKYKTECGKVIINLENLKISIESVDVLIECQAAKLKTKLLDIDSKLINIKSEIIKID